jgi:hypothetical protein
MPRKPQPGIVQFALDVPLDAKMRFESLHATLGFKNKSQTFQAIVYAVSTQDKIDPAALGRIEAGVLETLRLLESFQ